MACTDRGLMQEAIIKVDEQQVSEMIDKVRNLSKAQFLLKKVDATPD